MDASDHGIGAVLEQKDNQEKGRYFAFFSRKLLGSVKYKANGNVLGYMGQGAWSVRERETYALVSCLLKFTRWTSGRQVTVLTDHRSLESGYKEELCTMAGPSGHRGQWHEILSRYNIVVLYKPGVENDAADRMSRWAYPARMADDTNLHGSDTDLEGVPQWEASERGEEQRLIAANKYPCKVLKMRAPKKRASPQDMQEQRQPNYLLLQVNEPSCEKGSHWRTKVDPILREPIPLITSYLAPPTALFKDRESSVRSLIEADGELLGELDTGLRNRIYEAFTDSVFDPTGTEYAKIEANALNRGPKDVSFCKLE